MRGAGVLAAKRRAGRKGMRLLRLTSGAGSSRLRRDNGCVRGRAWSRFFGTASDLQRCPLSPRWGSARGRRWL